MKLLRNYFLKEFIGPLLFSLLVLTFVLLLGNLVKIADMVINRGVDILIVTKLFLYMIPYLLSYTLPISILVAVLLSLGRLSSDNEIIAIRASGVSVFKITAPIMVLSIIFSLLLVIFNDRVIPYAHFATRKTLVEVGIKNPTAILEPGVFINSFDKYILFIYSIEKPNKLNNIRIYEPQGNDKPARIIIARKGEFIADTQKNTIKLKLIDGTADEPDPNNPANFYKLNFKNYFMVLNLSQLQKKGNIEKKPKDMTIQELRKETASLQKQGITATPLLLEIHRKISLAFSCLVFTLLGLPVAIITRRREKSINFGIAFIIVALYYLLLLGAEALSPQGIFDPQLTLWLPNIILGTIGALLTFRLCAY